MTDLHFDLEARLLLSGGLDLIYDEMLLRAVDGVKLSMAWLLTDADHRCPCP
jgi:hypothetical protein